MSRLPTRFPLYAEKDPSSAELSQDVNAMLGDLHGRQDGYQQGMDGRPGLGALQQGANTRSAVTGGYASGARTPVPGNYSTPGDRFSNPNASIPEDTGLRHLDTGLSSLDGRAVPMPQGDYESGMQPGSGPVATAYPRPGLAGLVQHGGTMSDGGWSPDPNDPQGVSQNSSMYGDFRFPEMSCMVLPDDDVAENTEDSVKRLHEEMDMLLSGASQQKLTPEQQMQLRQSEIQNRAQMDAFRLPVTASIDRVMQRDGPRGPPNQHDPGMGPPGAPPPRHQDDGGVFGGFRCFRACS